MPQSLSKIYLHLIFSTKGREADIPQRLQGEMFAYIGGTLNSLGCQTVIVNGTDNHVHALFCMSRTKAVAEVVRDVKANAAKWMKDKLHCCFAWQDGYGVFSVSQSQVDKVRLYIINQEEHHRTRTFQEEFRKFLDNYGVVYDERYVWD